MKGEKSRMDGWLPGDVEREYGPPARWCEYDGGEMVQFLTDEGDVLVGMVLFASEERFWCGWWRRRVVLIVVTFCGDEWWISPANVVIP